RPARAITTPRNSPQASSHALPFRDARVSATEAVPSLPAWSTPKTLRDYSNVMQNRNVCRNGCRQFKGRSSLCRKGRPARTRKIFSSEPLCRPPQRLLQRRNALIASRDGSHGRPWHGIGERAEVADSCLVG